MRGQLMRILVKVFLSLCIFARFALSPISQAYTTQPRIIGIDKLFSESQVICQFDTIPRIYGLSLSGSLQLHQDKSLIRLILVREDLSEYLVYEAYPLIVDSNSLQITNVCDETCILEGVAPHSLKIELIDASLQIEEIALTTDQQTLMMEAAYLQKQIKEDRETAKIKRINANIKKRGLKWIAGETFVSKLSYREKKKLFGGKVPNLQGAEYYKGGIFEIKSADSLESSSVNIESSLVELFDWRSRHGASNPDSPYYDGDTSGSGWITPIRNQGSCGSCWAFSAVGATEALANIYFNQHLDVDYGMGLSEQDVLSCSGAGDCNGGLPGKALQYIADVGVVDEECFLYTEDDQPCENKCTNPYEIIRIKGIDRIDPAGEDEIKVNLLRRGPLNFAIRSWEHSMVLVGYEKDPQDGKTVWFLKNSWGSSWGEDGYGKMKVDLSETYHIFSLHSPVASKYTPFEIACHDMDGDGLYSWGISENRPASCPEVSFAEPDCDDSDSNLGPFDLNGYCIDLPVANFMANLTTGLAPLTVSFTDQSMGVIEVWDWDFGDGETTTEQNPSHIYHEPGIYDVLLTVTSVEGSHHRKSKSEYITVCAPNPYYKDADEDGHGDPNDSIKPCIKPSGYVTDNTDCDDSNPSIHPGATEVCNSKDDDCDGSIDEEVQATYFRDADGDGYGDSNSSKQACSQPSGYVTNTRDCDDTDPNEHPNQIWYKDLDSDGYSDGSTNTVSCTRPTGFKVAPELTAISGDCDVTDQNKYPGAPEVCNGEDDDCDGDTDEGCVFNNPPEADASPDQAVVEGETVKLDGSKSSDPDPGDNIASYQWTQIGGIPVTLSDPTAAKPKFVTPIVSPSGMILTFELVVEDKGDLQDSDQVTVTVNDNGISGFPDDVLTVTSSTGKEIGIKVESDLVSITAVDPATIPESSDKPDNLPYGLFDLLIKADAVGGTAKVTFYLESPAGDKDKWSKYKNSTGKWEDCSAYASFNAARDQVTLTLVDGGDGDDGPADGWIVDPSGLSNSASTKSSFIGGNGGGGGGGCFISTAPDG